MQVEQFLEKVAANPERPLLFEFAPGQRVQGGYHVTEIKNAQFDTIDCGNSLHRWQEVIVQVWVPDEATIDASHMPTDKFLKIWDVVDGRLSLYRDAEIRIEYDDGGHHTTVYHVDDIVSTDTGLLVQLAPPRTMCKPREILIPFGNAAAVAQQAGSAIRSRVEQVIPLTGLMGVTEAGCCSAVSKTDTSCC